MREGGEQCSAGKKEVEGTHTTVREDGSLDCVEEGVTVGLRCGRWHALRCAALSLGAGLDWTGL
jgi:hypothetical protein